MVPLGAELLICLHAEEGVVSHVVHLVVHNPVGLRIETLEEPETGRQKV